MDQNEVARGVRLTAKTIEYVHFKVPRKATGFQADLYPPIPGQEPAMKFEDYVSGVDKEPLRVDQRLDSKPSEGGAKKATFAARVESVGASAAVRSQADQDEINALNRKIKELTEDLSQALQEVSQLKEEVESLTQNNENIVSSKQYLESQLAAAQDQIAQLSAQGATYQTYSQE